MFTWEELYNQAAIIGASDHEAREYADYMLELYRADNHSLGWTGDIIEKPLKSVKVYSPPPRQHATIMPRN